MGVVETSSRDDEEEEDEDDDDECLPVSCEAPLFAVVCVREKRRRREEKQKCSEKSRLCY